MRFESKDESGDKTISLSQKIPKPCLPVWGTVGRAYYFLESMTMPLAPPGQPGSKEPEDHAWNIHDIIYGSLVLTANVCAFLAFIVSVLVPTWR